ncbi:UDP-forming cellulose synthase catalytic subunit [Orrella marina]|uniref:Cellulose synthase catalytic subunit [UDP-forming] n=1 Tax=Orrella marina TaxID=2163011 RepID=A0A2R4XM13_9BURK|nr:UDP-forming cellulose synthase catalytic subunit [Orrella marina]AWB34833.1 cellulose synthase catalytic subunit (UDP-forming) [Orrella marina]
MTPTFRARIAKAGNSLVSLPVWSYPIFQWLALSVSLLFFISVVVTPLSLTHQILFGLITFATAYAITRVSTNRLAVLILMMLSSAASLRYLYWRVTETLGFENWVDAMFGYGLMMAELYAMLTLFLSYFQSAWPLQRKPAFMPPDSSTWPSVDVFIPTYNEPISVVRQTAVAAKLLDWPSDRLNIYVLDDGRRDELREFCEQAGIGYLIRPDNKHAKAGNINAALEKTDGEFVAIFDCDHIPTRSFLQIALGWFIKDPKLAMLQTPHVFFSPDPMEQNLDVFNRVPNEGQLFYGLTQDSNDLWNATFFCGSCAVIRREHMMQVGGMATESVTEDALTALKMNSIGLNTAYLALPLAAGLATETLSRHIGQRIRWGRGMAQIMRNHNPLVIKGLKLSQRICYLSASLHFFYGLPRLVFLTAPLAYLFFGAHVFQAAPLMILAYVFPHILHAQITNLQIQGRFRHSFWNEVYESVLAWYLMRPTLATLINPDKATFNVTAKGGIKNESYFDWVLARPYIILLLLNVAGMFIGIWLILTSGGDQSLIYTAVFNLVWTTHNVVICGASVAVAGEQKQLRASPRVNFSIPATLALPTGHRFVCHTSDFSADGLGLVMKGPLNIELGELVYVSLFRGDEEEIFPARVRFNSDNRIGLRFYELSIEQQVRLSQMTFGRADLWAQKWVNTVPDSPLSAIRQIGRFGVRGVFLLIRESGKAIGNRASRVWSRRPAQS